VTILHAHSTAPRMLKMLHHSCIDLHTPKVEQHTTQHTLEVQAGAPLPSAVLLGTTPSCLGCVSSRSLTRPRCDGEESVLCRGLSLSPEPSIQVDGSNHFFLSTTIVRAHACWGLGPQSQRVSTSPTSVVVPITIRPRSGGPSVSEAHLPTNQRQAATLKLIPNHTGGQSDGEDAHPRRRGKLPTRFACHHCAVVRQSKPSCFRISAALSNTPCRDTD
jgi:hypothetical protein